LVKVITLTTDFGLRDAYVAAMKGVILSINPQVTIIDLCHEIEPQNILQAAFVLHTAYKYFPQGTIHVIVVDPGVGTERRAVLLLAQGNFFLAPDNGVLSYILAESREYRAFNLNNPRYWLSTVSSTFHGRDIFAPVAAHLSRGIPAEELAEPIPSLVSFPIPSPYQSGLELIGEVLHIDHFGNLITNISSQDLPQARLTVEIGQACIEGLSQTYARGGDILALIGSSGYLEIAAKNKSAAKLLQVGVGSKVKIKPVTGGEDERCYD
jgi:hypothetical protein